MAATATDATATPVKATRNRSKSPFTATVKVTVNVHSDLPIGTASMQYIQDMMTGALSEYAVKATHATRAVKAGSKAKTTPTVPSLSVYVAPAGFKFAATAERGVRLDSETANLLRAIATQMGLDPSDPASIIAVAKALAVKAGAK